MWKEKDTPDSIPDIYCFEVECRQCHFKTRYPDSSKFHDSYQDLYEDMRRRYISLDKEYLKLRDILNYIRGDLNFL